MMDRRKFLSAIGIFALSAPRFTAVLQSPERDSDYPYLPDAIYGSAVIASNIRAQSLFTEPLVMIFAVFGLPDEEAAAAALSTATEHAFERTKNIDLDADYNTVSVGPLGDERIGIYAEEVGGARDLVALIRVGPNILHVRSMAMGGDTVAFVADFLSSFLEGATDDPRSLEPDISDMPPGWELDIPVWSETMLDNLTSPTWPDAATPRAEL